MKLNNKYRYYKVPVKPEKEDFKSEDDYNFAMALYNTSSLFDLKVTENPLKFKTIRRPRKEIKVGAEIKIERFDGNGYPAVVKVLRLSTGVSRAVVYTTKGYFIFSKDNCQKDSIDFHWTSKGREWDRRFRKWIDGISTIYVFNK